jgi:hypothetical protein
LNTVRFRHTNSVLFKNTYTEIVDLCFRSVSVGTDKHELHKDAERLLTVSSLSVVAEEPSLFPKALFRPSLLHERPVPVQRLPQELPLEELDPSPLFPLSQGNENQL